MGFGESISTCFSKYVTFSGRASRSEYWWFVLFLLLGQILLAVIDGMLFGAEVAANGPLGGIFSLGVLLPAISVGVRRLHDIGRTGWWWLIYFVPLIGTIVMLVFTCTASERGANRYGPDPLTGDEDLADVFA